MRRNLWFWARYTWEGMQVVVLVLAILLVLSAVGASRLELAALATSAPAYLLLAAGMTIIMLNYSAQALYTPLLLSMGETRRNIFLGYHFYRALIIAVAVGLSALIWALVPGEIARLGLRNIPSILAILVIVSALGGIIGTLYAKWRGGGHRDAGSGVRHLGRGRRLLLCRRRGGCGPAGGARRLDSGGVPLVADAGRRRDPCFGCVLPMAAAAIDIRIV